ncbi:helix-turn-helix domain-containing protein [uncultured Boseongicola sp.]|jgi:AraC-like DNA-binding protein|uniref:helix-turn-helix domain-containing protein n=1 Tax=uncultured Boseongicola sp. TaxID=1648499 RepID=UPI0026177794|nr:helix-turn-helix domain-containing protein [uncultured Boseongicola sp.]
MQPDLEVIQIGRGETFRAHEHGYPYPTVRWHFHPEYELHHVVATTGRYFVGDFIGAFKPGNLVLTGPNLPHNWVSDVDADEKVPLRNRVLQFTDEAIRGAMDVIPELQCVSATLDKSRSGLLFSETTTVTVEPLLAELVNARGIRRIELFIGIFGALTQDCESRQLTGAEYLPDPSGYMSSGLNAALAFIDVNLTELFNEGDLADIAGVSRTTFSRSFRKHTGMSLVRYINRLRIGLACQLLISDQHEKITDVCYASGFNNLSNFNRQFAAQKGMSPSRFRARMLEHTNLSLDSGRSIQAA